MTDDLKALAAELDELGGRGGAIDDDARPDLTAEDFRLLDRIGSGGMGSVYTAEQISLGRRVAVKLIRAAGGADVPEEARTVARLHHPNIVQAYAAGRAGDFLWMAMELADGESADRHTFRSADELARFGIAVAEALAYAHACGILHRDVKPSNIFLRADGSVQLGDFGLACLAASRAPRGGTAGYLAPEVLAGGAATEKSDQYALGRTLTERAAGSLGQHGVPADLAAICAKAAAESPEKRYNDMTALCDDLRRFLARRPVAARPPSPVRRLVLFARRNPAAAVGTLAAALSLAGFVAALAIGYLRTARSLEAVHREAARASWSLVGAMTKFDRSEADPRDTELRRAEEIAQRLADRFPDDASMQAAVEEIRKARERRAESLRQRPPNRRARRQ